MFVDGTEQTGLIQKDEWNVEKTVLIPDTAALIAVKCIDIGGVPGILASVEGSNDGNVVVVSDSGWKCSAVEQLGWQNPGFVVDMAYWQDATEINDHGGKPWGYVGDISASAKWIWTNRYTWTHDIDKTVYCRGVIGSRHNTTGTIIIKKCGKVS